MRQNGCSLIAEGMKLLLPWPPRVLSPNARVHYRVKSRAAKQFRLDCAWIARSQGACALQAVGLHLSLIFVPPSRHAFDLDNALAAMKSGLDGLADVLNVDDSLWAFSIAKAAQGRIGGFVEVQYACTGG